MRGALARTLLIAPKSWLLGPMEDSEGTRAVLGAGQARSQRPAPWLGHLLLISLLFMLNVTLFFTLNTGMDLYGFYTLKPLSAQPLPAVLCALLNLVLAMAAYVFYWWLYRRQVWFTGEHWGPFRRGAVLSGAPVLLAYGPSMVLTSHGGKPSVFVVAALITGSLCVIHALPGRSA